MASLAHNQPGTERQAEAWSAAFIVVQCRGTVILCQQPIEPQSLTILPIFTMGTLLLDLDFTTIRFYFHLAPSLLSLLFQGSRHPYRDGSQNP